MGVEEESAIGERKLESGVGRVLWSMRAPVRKVWSVGMMRPVGMTRFVGMARFVWMTRLLWVIEPTRRIRLGGMVRMTRRLWFIGAMGTAVVSPPARMLDLLRLGPSSVFVALKVLVGIEGSLYHLSVFQVLGKVRGIYE